MKNIIRFVLIACLALLVVVILVPLSIYDILSIYVCVKPSPDGVVDYRDPNYERSISVDTLYGSQTVTA